MAGLTVPRDLQEITAAWLTRALESSRESGDASVVAYSAEVIAEGKGFMNRLFRLALEYDANSPGGPDTIIVKLPSADPALRGIADRLGHHRREVGFYREVADDSRLPTPRCYHSGVDAATGDTVLALEDMRGARQGDSVAGCSMADARAAIARLASFHAAWWDSPRLDGLDWMPLKMDESEAYQAIYPGAWKSLVDKAGDGMPEGLRRLGDRLLPEVQGIKAELTRAPRTVVHGDFRLDNCFFGGPGDARSPVVFDWEFCARGRGACDVATFVSEAFAAEERRAVEADLLGLYHSALVDNGALGYSLDECWRDYRLAMLEIFVFWIVAGGFCDYDDERATVYLRNTLARFDAAIADLEATELL